jgi:hypothetical protein
MPDILSECSPTAFFHNDTILLSLANVILEENESGKGYKWHDDGKCSKSPFDADILQKFLSSLGSSEGGDHVW